MKHPENHRQRLGKWGEEAAAAYLTGNGFEILAENLRTPYGEIDLLARKDSVLVFVEVKTRSNRAYGEPEAAITEKKKAHMLAAAEAYLQSHPDQTSDWRVDVISIVRLPGDDMDLQHFENAIS